MELGIITLSDLQADPGTGRPVRAVDRLNDTIAYARLADQLGLDVFALGEHHSLDFAVSSPAVVLGAVAGQTETIRLTGAVSVLSVLDPVRVYQDFATLDLLSHGRAEISAGRSAFVEPFALFGTPLDEYDALFAEKLGLLLQIRAQQRVTWNGRYRPPLVDAEISPRAFQDPLPIWVGIGGSPESAARAGRLGLPIMIGYIGGTLAHARRAVEIYRAAGAAAGHSEELRVGTSTHFFAADSEHQADELFPYYHEYLRPKKPGGRGFVVGREAFDAGRERQGALMIGTSEQLIAKILDAHDALGITRFFGQIDWGGLPRDAVESSITRLAAETRTGSAWRHHDGRCERGRATSPRPLGLSNRVSGTLEQPVRGLRAGFALDPPQRLSANPARAGAACRSHRRGGLVHQPERVLGSRATRPRDEPAAPRGRVSCRGHPSRYAANACYLCGPATGWTTFVTEAPWPWLI